MITRNGSVPACPRERTYVGDTQKDQDAARLAGIPFIHAAYGFGKVQAPDAVIRSLAELPDVIDALAASL